MKTFSLKKEEIKKEWILIDAKDAVLGRLAVFSANVLRGKNKPNYTPNQDCGDNLIIINSDYVHLTGKKAKDKSNEIIKLAIKRMIPSGPLGKKQLSNCKIYSGEKHSHEAQQPKKVDFTKLNEKNFKR